MTVIVEAPFTTAVVDGPVRRPDFEDGTSWARAAMRAHALLSQTMPDEEIDELVDTAIPLHRVTFVLPRYFFG